MEISDIVLLLVLLCLSAIFSGSETAFTSLSPSKVKALVQQKRFAAGMVQKLKNNPHKLLSTVLVGNTIVNIASSAIATSIFTEMFGSRGVGIATGVMIFLILIFGEVLPKSLATEFAAPIALIMAWPVFFVEKILTLPVWFFENLSRAVHSLFGKHKQHLVSEDELKAMADLGAREGSIEKHEREFIENIFEFNDITVENIMTPRIDVDMLNAETTIKEAIAFINAHPHSRFPIYKTTVDNILGIITVRDLMQEIGRGTDHGKKIGALELNEPLRVPVTKKIHKLFKEFQKSRIHMAIVIDEHGGCEGIITLEDVLEEIVGEITDEHEMPERLVERIDNNTIKVKGKTEMEIIKRAMKTKINCSDHDPVSWFILEELHRFPHEGEEINVGLLTFKVEVINKDTIEEVEVTRRRPNMSRGVH